MIHIIHNGYNVTSTQLGPPFLKEEVEDFWLYNKGGRLMKNF